MGKKKNVTQFKDFESVSDTATYQVGYIRMLDVQLICMNELTANAFRLYIMMKSYAKSEAEFQFPHRIHKTFMSKQTFVTARQELIDLGYIEPFVSCKSVMKANIYKFSSRWRSRHKEYIASLIESRKKTH